jgi:hypothetical protein
MYRENSVLSHLDDGNKRVFQNVFELIPHYIVSHPEDCILHSHRSENSNLIGLVSVVQMDLSFCIYGDRSCFIISLALCAFALLALYNYLSLM